MSVEVHAHLKLQQEIERCKRDFPYFCRKYIRILTKEDGMQPFELNRHQLRLWNLIRWLHDQGRPVRLVILKARQMGISTFMQAYLFWSALVDFGTGGMVIAHDEESTAELFGKIELMYEELAETWPELFAGLEQVRDTKKTGKKRSWKAPFNTSLYVQTAGNKRVGRSRTLKRLHLSEVGYWEYADKIMFGLGQSVGRKAGTEIFVESTANGIGNYFHRMWNRAGKLRADGTITKGESSYIGVFFGWNEEPGYVETVPEGFTLTKEERKLKAKFSLSMEQMAWRRAVIEDECEGDEDLFRQEYPITPEEAFLVSGIPYFGRRTVEHYLNATTNPIRQGYLEVVDNKPKFIDDEDGPWRIWKKPIPGRPYVIGADPAGGTSKDFSAAAIIDVEKLEVVATFRGKLDPDEFARELKWMGKTYNTALIAVEKIGEGRATVLKLQKDLGYWRQFHHEYDEEWSGGIVGSWGWKTSSRTRPTMLAQAKALLREKDVQLWDDRFANEIASFVRNPENPSKIAEAQSGTNDDCVMCLCIALSSEVRAQGAWVGEVGDETDDYAVSVPG